MEETIEGGGNSMVPYLAIFLIGFIIAVIYITGILKLPNSYTDVQLCRQSVDLSSMTHIEGMNMMDELECPPVEIAVTNKDEKAIKRKVADQMADCWYKFGGDSKELFDKNFGKDRFCAVCSVIEFEGSADNRKIMGFPEFLADNNVKQSYGGKRYVDYLAVKTPADLDRIKKDNMVIDTSKDYVVLFVYDKTGKFGEWLGAGSFGSAGAVTAIVAGVIAGGPLLPVLSIAGVAAIVTGSVGYSIGEDSEMAAMTVLMPYSAQSFDSLGCELMPVKQGNR